MRTLVLQSSSVLQILHPLPRSPCPERRREIVHPCSEIGKKRCGVWIGISGVLFGSQGCRSRSHNSHRAHELR
ncbi:hypothetical protein DAI22_11g040000 [Oryza sativa Japonica Group]|nr:hypothetical protein DAI22_11g040000 [Oryza sativa Japonica Group]KAF2909618.1 hypothetical protein DAI22_11g040000 [Oryza sativa Japonica Group]